MFIQNFQKFTDSPDAKKLIAVGPRL